MNGTIAVVLTLVVIAVGIAYPVWAGIVEYERRNR